MPIFVLLPLILHRLFLLRALSWLVFRTILTLLHIYFYKTFFTIRIFTYVINAWF